MAIPQGWTVNSIKTNEVTARFEIKEYCKEDQKPQRLWIYGDWVTGDFEFKISTDVHSAYTMYKYNAGTNSGSPAGFGAWKDFFNCPAGQQALQKFIRIAKQGIFNTAKHNVDSGSGRSNLYGPGVTQPEGYQSFGNGTWEASPQVGDNVGVSTSTNETPGSVGIGTTWKTYDDLNWNDIWGHIGDFHVVGGSKHAVYRYPYNSNELAEFGYDFIQITAYDYTTSFGPDYVVTSDEWTLPDYKPGSAFDNLGIPSFEAGDSTTQTGLLPARTIFRRGEERFAKQRWETIQLPMQPKISESASVDWGDGDRLNDIQARLGAVAGSAIRDFAGISGVNFGTSITNFINNLTNAGSEWLNDPGLQQYLVAYFAGQAVGSDIIGRTTGTVLNPNLELIFQGPRLKMYNFSFKLTPRDAKESTEIRKIIRCLKRNSAPQLSTSNLFLKAPRIFKLEYIHNVPGTDNPLIRPDNKHPFLNKFKPCVLTNFTVDYTPDGSYMTYDENGSMTSYTLGMQFSEIEATYANEYDENDDDAKDMGF